MMKTYCHFSFAENVRSAFSCVLSILAVPVPPNLAQAARAGRAGPLGPGMTFWATFLWPKSIFVQNMFCNTLDLDGQIMFSEDLR